MTAQPGRTAQREADGHRALLTAVVGKSSPRCLPGHWASAWHLKVLKSPGLGLGLGSDLSIRIQTLQHHP